MSSREWPSDQVDPYGRALNWIEYPGLPSPWDEPFLVHADRSHCAYDEDGPARRAAKEYLAAHPGLAYPGRDGALHSCSVGGWSRGHGGECQDPHRPCGMWHVGPPGTPAWADTPDGVIPGTYVTLVERKSKRPPWVFVFKPQRGRRLYFDLRSGELSSTLPA